MKKKIAIHAGSEKLQDILKITLYSEYYTETWQ